MIVRNEIPLLEYDDKSPEVIAPDHDWTAGRLPEKCLFAFLGESVHRYAEAHAAQNQADSRKEKSPASYCRRNINSTVEKRKVLHPTVGTTAKNAKSLFGEGEQFISNVNCFFYLLPEFVSEIASPQNSLSAIHMMSGMVTIEKRVLCVTVWQAYP